MAGLWLEDFTIGQVFDHPLRRTVTETDNLLMSALTHNPAPLHLDAEYMKGTEYGRILVNSCFTLGLMVGVSVNDTTQGTAVANLGWDEVRFPKPHRQLLLQTKYCHPILPTYTLPVLDTCPKMVSTHTPQFRSMKSLMPQNSLQ
jgi:hypothetical protein